MTVCREVRRLKSMAALSDKDAEDVLADYQVEIRSQVKQFVARTRRHPWLDPDDLVTIAQLAVLEAAMSFKERGTSFSTWVGKLIRWRIQEALEVPEDRAAVYHVQSVIAKESPDGAITPELQEQLDVIRANYRDLKSKMYQTISLDAPADAGVSYTVIETIPGTLDSPEDILIAKEEVQLLRRSIESAPIDFRAKLIFSAEMIGTTNAALARELGLTRQRVDQIRETGFEMLCEEAVIQSMALLPSDFTPAFHFRMTG